MDQLVYPISEQVKEVVQAVMEALRVPKSEEVPPSVAANSFEAEALRSEIIRVGRKLWQRAYVDGNGGNISVRLGSKYVLHLEIYKANPRARAVVHCHPPYATAFALAGTPPPVGLITEYEVFIGPAAVAPYETPGTQAFAETVLPFVQDHNTILLANHGVVCWSDSVTHAEWLVEVLDGYCKTYLIAQQVGKPLAFIPEDKIKEILALKRRLGFPDARMELLPELDSDAPPQSAELEQLVKRVIARLEER
jgi:L-fuculose-phosphate aldolase